MSGLPFGPGTFTSSLKVGIGEVFIIAGQSNAEGGHREFGDTGSFVLPPNTDQWRMDAVRVINEADPPQDWRDYPNDYKRVKQLTSTKQATQIGPRGRSLWYWASVGGQLAQDCGVPVAFFNAAFGDTTITQWATSTNPDALASGQYTPTNIQSPTADRFIAGSPYGFFGNMLRLYTSTYGVRAVLWMQGESDTKALVQKEDPLYKDGWADRPLFNRLRNQVLPPTNAANEPNEKLWVRNSAEYAAKLRAVIQKSRTEVPGKEVPWVISQTSYIGANPSRRDLDNGGVSSQIVRDGQLISAIGLPGLYQMTNTDDLLSTYRILFGADWPVHFNSAGTQIIADRWSSALKDICRNNRLLPVTLQDLGTEPRELEISENGAELTAPSGFADYRWVSGRYSFDLNTPIAQTQSIATPSEVARYGSGTSKTEVFAKSAVQTSGTYQVVLQNSNGLPILTQAVDFPYVIVDDTGYTPPPTTTTNQCKAGNENSGGNRTPNGAIVGGFGNSSEFMEYTFTNIPSAGNYTFTIRYASGDAQAGINLRVNGGAVQPMRPAGTASWTPGPEASQTLALNAGTNTIRIEGSGQGNFTFDRLCINAGGAGTGTTTPPPPPPTSFAITGVQLNCSNGVVTMSLSGANANPVEYRAIGLQDWSTNPLTIPSWQRNGTTFTLWARQAGNPEVSTNFTSACSNGRLALAHDEPETTQGLLISPNPTTGRVVVRFTLTDKQAGTLSVVNLSGQTLQAQPVSGTGRMQEESVDLSRQPAGVYVVRLQAGNRVNSGKVVLQR